MIGTINIHSIEVWLAALAITVTLLAGFGMFARWCSVSPAVPVKKLELLRVGMTTDEVRAVLGAPRQMRMSDAGARTWVYGSAMKRHLLLIEFNEGGNLASFAHGIPPSRLHPPGAPPPPNI
jgi:outer membrane protein assembly factor BamE (lipoprotein component of BamABCDE complex)